jgi:hypothetical protein
LAISFWLTYPLSHDLSTVYFLCDNIYSLI